MTPFAQLSCCAGISERNCPTSTLQQLTVRLRSGFSNILNDYSLELRLHTSVFLTFPPQMIAFPPPSASTRRLLDGMVASVVSSPAAILKAGDLHAALMDYAVIGNTRVPKRGAWRVHLPSLPPCQRRRKKICQRKKFSVERS